MSNQNEAKPNEPKASFFEKQKALAEKLTTLPWTVTDYTVEPIGNKGIASDSAEMFIVEPTARVYEPALDYTVFCVNNMAKVCELLEKSLSVTIKVSEYEEIQAELEKLIAKD